MTIRCGYRQVLPAAALVAMAAPLMVGCAVVGYTATILQPPKKVKAKFDLPKDGRTLVFVDDAGHETAYEGIKRELTEHLNRALNGKELVKETVPYEELSNLRLATPEFNRLAIGEVGRRLGAELVIYVEITRFSLKDTDADVMWNGRLEVAVAVKRVGQGWLWPKDRVGGYPVEPVVREPAASTSEGYGRRLAAVLAATMADRIAKLFYTHRLKWRPGREEKRTESFEGS